MNDKHIINFSCFKPTNFNRQFWKHIQGQLSEQFLPLGIWQFYPSYITIAQEEMIVDNKISLSLINDDVFAYHYKKFFKKLNEGAVV